MTQEDKKLLLNDLCARLPYGVKFLRESWNFEWDQELSVIEVLEDIDKEGYINNAKVYNVEDIKPYLRSMSSMTEEENKERIQLGILCAINDNHERIFDGFGNESVDTQLKALDWLNANHFDFRNLIERGLAIAVTKENNPYKN